MADLGNLFFTLGIKVGDVEGIDRLMQELDRPRKTLSELEKMSKSSVAALGKDSRTLANAMSAAATASEKEKNKLAATTSELTKQTAAADKAAASNDRLARSWGRLLKGGTIGRQTADNLRMAGYAKLPEAAGMSADYWRRKEYLSELEQERRRKEELVKSNQRYVASLERAERTQGRAASNAYIKNLTKQKQEVKELSDYYKSLEKSALEALRIQQRVSKYPLSPMLINNDRLYRQNWVLNARRSLDDVRISKKHAQWEGLIGNRELAAQNRLLSQLRTAASTYVSIWTAGQFLKSLVRITGEFELQRVSLRAMLNDINAADKIFSQTKLLAVESPFQFMDLMGFAKQLAAFSVPVNELFDTTKMLSDISAGLGVDMGRIVLAYSQIRSAGFLKGTELRQLTEAGVPVLEDLSRMFTQMEGQAVTIGDVFERISLRQVPFEMIEQVFKDMTSEGGKFYRMQEIQAETLRGQVSNLVDAWQIALYELGSSSDGILKFGVGAIRTLIENLNLVIPAIVGVASAYGIYTAAALIVNSTNTSLALGLTKLGKAFKAVGTAVKANPFVAILTALAALAPIIIRLIKRSNELENSLRDIADMNFSGAEESVYSFQKLVEQLKNAAKGSKDYSDAVMALNSRYGEYLPNMLNEADALETITSRYHDVTDAIYAKAQAQAYEAQMNKISEEYDSDIAEQESEIIKLIEERADATRSQAADIFRAFRSQLMSEKWRYSGEQNGYLGSLMDEIIGRYMGYSNKYTEYLSGRRVLKDFNDDNVIRYTNLLRKRDEAYELAYAIMGEDFKSYDTAEERRRAEAIQRIYDNEIRRINADGSLNESGRAAATNRAEIARLQALIELYGSPEFRNASKLNGYIRELNSLMNDDTEGWIKKAQAIKDIYDEQGFKLTLRPELESREEHIKGWKQDYDSAVSSLANIGAEDNVSESVLNALRIRIEALNELSNLLGYGNGFEGFDIQGKNRDKAAKEQLDLIRDWIDRIKEVRDLYEEFRLLGVQDAQMMSLFGSIFGEFEGHGIDSGALAALRGYNFDEALRIYNDMLRNGTPEMQAAADENDEDEALRNAEQRLEQLERAKKIGEQLQGVYEELAGIMAVSGTGVEHDFSKIVSDLRRQENELRRERDESRKDIEEKYGIDEKLDEYNSAMDAVDELYNAKLDNLRVNASEKIRDLASRYVDELIKSNRLDLSDYADKTIKQIRGQLDVLWDIYGQIQNELVLAQGEQTVAEALGEDIDSTLLSKIEMLKESLAQLGIVIENTEDESSKKLFENIRQIADSVSSLGNSFTNLGESLDNVNLSGFGEALSFVGGLTSSLMSALADPSPMGWANFGLNVLVSVINLIADSIQQARESAEEFRLAMIDYHNSLSLMETDLNDEDYDTIFGTNSFQKAVDAYSNAREVLAKYRKEIKGLENIQVRTLDRSNFANFFGAQDEYASLKDIAPEIFGKNGDINIDALRAFLDTNADITEEDRMQLEYILEMNEQYEELLGIVKDVNAELMAEVSDDISNAIFDAVLNGADAWDAFNDSAVRVIDNIGRKMIQEFIVQSYLNQFQDELEAAWGKEDRPQALAEILFDIYGGLGEVLGEGMEAYQDWLDMMQANGLDISSLYGQGESLGKDIQRITEDQADLLASYVNAIRAYVAQLVERGIATGELLTSINENINIALSVLKEINGNTQAINENTAQVGRLMKSLTTSGSSVAINARIM